MAMPEETQVAVDWALQQTYAVDGEEYPVSESRHMLVDTVRRYFDDHNIGCPPMDATMLDPYLPPDSPIRRG